MDNVMGYSYFGARYEACPDERSEIGNTDLSVWLSVDPFSELYPETSPYMYVLGNPVRLNDPNGMWHWDKTGNIVADEGDDDFSLYFFMNNHLTGALGEKPLTYTVIRNIYYSMYKGTAISKDNIAGRQISLSDIKRIAGDHVANCFNPIALEIRDGEFLGGFKMHVFERTERNTNPVHTRDHYPEQTPMGDPFWDSFGNPNHSQRGYGREPKSGQWGGELDRTHPQLKENDVMYIWHGRKPHKFGYTTTWDNAYDTIINDPNPPTPTSNFTNPIILKEIKVIED